MFILIMLLNAIYRIALLLIRLFPDMKLQHSA